MACLNDLTYHAGTDINFFEIYTSIYLTKKMNICHTSVSCKVDVVSQGAYEQQ